MFKSVRAKLLSVFGLGAVVFGVVLVQSVWNSSEMRTHLRGLYAHQVAPMEDLKEIVDAYAVDVVDATHKLRSGQFDWSGAEASINSAMSLIHERWSAYVAGDRSVEERTLIDSAAPLMAEADAGVADLLGFIAAQDMASVERSRPAAISTSRMDGAYRGAFAELQTNVNGTVAKLPARETVGEIMSATRDMRKATGEIAEGAGDLSSRAENQAASLEEVAATMEEMSATVKKNAENAVSASSSPRMRASAPTRAGDRRAGRHRDERDRGRLGQDRRHRQRDRRLRLPDQPAGAERGGGGGAGRRGRQGLRGGRLRGAHAGAALGRGRARHQGADRPELASGEGRRAAGEGDRRFAGLDRGGDPAGLRDRHRDLGGQPRAELGRGRDHLGADLDGRDHPAELGAGRGKRR
jgi:hypothetical protein